jgi:hypothetical protein
VQPNPISIRKAGMRFLLPTGDYPGYSEWRTMRLPGGERTEISKAVLILDEETVKALAINPNVVSCDVLPNLKAGSIQFIPS